MEMWEDQIASVKRSCNDVTNAIKIRENNSKEWTGLDFNSRQYMTTDDRRRWRKMVSMSTMAATTLVVLSTGIR